MTLNCNTYGPLSEHYALSEFVHRMLFIDTCSIPEAKEIYNAVMIKCCGHVPKDPPSDYKLALVRYIYTFPANWIEYICRLADCSKYMLTREEEARLYPRYLKDYREIAHELQLGLMLNLPETYK